MPTCACQVLKFATSAVRVSRRGALLLPGACAAEMCKYYVFAEHGNVKGSTSEKYRGHLVALASFRLVLLFLGEGTLKGTGAIARHCETERTFQQVSATDPFGGC